MSSQTLPTMETFLKTDLTPYVPSNLDDECSICQISWREDAESPISLPCGCKHHYHKSCITTWVEEGIGALATCPCCRLNLSTRPKNNAPEFDFEFGTDDYDDYDEPWEGLSASMTWVSGRVSALNEMIWLSLQRSVGPRNRNGGEPPAMSRADWSALVVEIVQLASDRIGFDPISTDEFVVVNCIIDNLIGEATSRGLGTEYLCEMLDCLHDHEDHAETRSIQEAFEAIGLRALVPALEWDGSQDGSVDESKSCDIVAR